MAKSLNMKAGRLLTKFIRQIAEECTEVIKDEDNPLEARMVSKAEAMARKMWDIALGYTETIVRVDGPIDIVHPPDHKMMTILLDRLEGRAATATEDETLRPTAAQKVSEAAQKRIADAGGLDVGHAPKTVT
jgi:hypothetical protein